jgi:uncharacterized protein YndB with AHSA1/START domain
VVTEIVHRVGFEAPPRRVYRALTVTDELAAWWTRDVTGSGDLGSVLVFGFPHRALAFRFFVQELSEPKLVRWRCLGGHPEWKDTEITFTLTEAEQRTTLDFEHRGWRSASSIYRASFVDWAHSLASLQAYVDLGTGWPRPG